MTSIVIFLVTTSLYFIFRYALKCQSLKWFALGTNMYDKQLNVYCGVRPENKQVGIFKDELLCRGSRLAPSVLWV